MVLVSPKTRTRFRMTILKSKLRHHKQKVFSCRYQHSRMKCCCKKWLNLILTSIRLKCPVSVGLATASESQDLPQRKCKTSCVAESTNTNSSNKSKSLGSFGIHHIGWQMEKPKGFLIQNISRARNF